MNNDHSPLSRDRTVLFLPWLALTLLFAPVFYTLYRSGWAARDYGHAYFILPISLWLLWRQRKTLIALSAKPGMRSTTVTGLLLIGIGLGLHIIGRKWDYLVISSGTLLPVAAGMVLVLFNGSMLRSIAFPLGYLCLLLPPPLGIIDTITLPMRYGIAVAAYHILTGLHYPLERNGLLLSVRGHEIYMGEPCSGLRSLLTLLALSTVYIYISRTPRQNKLILLILCLPLALLGNLLRVMAVCLFTYYWGEGAGQKFFHDYSGYVMFAVVIGGLLGCEAILSYRTIRNNIHVSD